MNCDLMDSNVTRLFEEFNNKNIRYCSFKSNEHLIEGILGNTDLDILIDINEYENAVIILRKYHFTQVEPIGVGSYPNVVNWYGMDYQTGNLIHIHLHFELMTGKSLVKDYCLPWKDFFLDNIIIDENTAVKCVNPTLEYILLFTRIFIKRNTKPSKVYFAEDTKKEIDFLYNKIEYKELNKWVKIFFPECDAEKITKILYNKSNCDETQFIWLYNSVKKTLVSSQRFSEISALIRSYLNRTIRKITREINSAANTTLPLKKRFINSGLSVAFVGIDGSGKSTISKLIGKWLGSEFDIKVYYAGAGDGKKDKLSTLLLTMYGKYGHKTENDNHIGTPVVEYNADKEKSKHSIKRKIKGIGSSIAYNRILASNIRHLKEANALTAKGLVCLMDRYPQNSVPFVHDGAKVKKYDTGRGILHFYSEKERKYLESIKQTPFDLVIKLHVSGETSYKRKPLESLESLKYKEMTLDNVIYDAKEMVVIDAEADLEEVLLAVKRVIWDRLSMK